MQIVIGNREAASLQYEMEILRDLPPSEPVRGLTIESKEPMDIAPVAETIISVLIAASEDIEPGTYFLHLEVSSPADNRESGWYFPINVA